jgi:hypothetical protein
MQRVYNSWHVRNLLVMVLRFNKLAEHSVSLHTTLLRPSMNIRPLLQCILHYSRIVHNAREDPFALPRSFMLKQVHLGKLATQTYQTTTS